MKPERGIPLLVLLANGLLIGGCEKAAPAPPANTMPVPSAIESRRFMAVTKLCRLLDLNHAGKAPVIEMRLQDRDVTGNGGVKYAMSPEEWYDIVTHIRSSPSKILVAHRAYPMSVHDYADGYGEVAMFAYDLELDEQTETIRARMVKDANGKSKG